MGLKSTNVRYHAKIIEECMQNFPYSILRRRGNEFFASYLDNDSLSIQNITDTNSRLLGGIG